MNSIMFRPQNCRFFLYAPFNEIMNDHLQNLAFDPVNGALLTFESSSDQQLQSVIVEIDSEGNVSRVSVVNPVTGSVDMSFDFSGGVFIHHGDCLDIICGHPLFHMLQQTFAAHYQNGHYSVTVTAR
jgi:hypothetical protein